MPVIIRTVGAIAVGGVQRDFDRASYANNAATFNAAIHSFDGQDFSENGGTQCFVDIYPEGSSAYGEWILNTSALEAPINTTNASQDDHLTVRAASGTSFADHPSAIANALRYNPANGVAIRAGATGGPLWQPGYGGVCQWLEIVGLQLKHTGGNYSCIGWTSGCTSGIARNCIIESGGDVNGITTTTSGHWLIYNNCLYKCAIHVSSSGASEIIHNTVYLPAAVTRGAIRVQIGAALVQNNIGISSGTDPDFFAFTGGSFAAGSGWLASGDNSPIGGTACVFDQAASSVFENVNAGTEDFRINSNTLETISRGALTTNLTTDIIGQPRSGATPSMGAWELDFGGTTSAALSGTSSSVNQGAARAAVAVRL